MHAKYMDGRIWWIQKCKTLQKNKTEPNPPRRPSRWWETRSQGWEAEQLRLPPMERRQLRLDFVNNITIATTITIIITIVIITTITTINMILATLHVVMITSIHLCQNESLKRYQINDNVLMIKKKENMFTFYLLPDNRELKLVPRWEITRSKDHFFTFTILISHGIDIDDIDIHCQWHPPNEC